MTTASYPRVHVLFYNSVVTGSCDLRNFHKAVVTNTTTNRKKLRPVGKYAQWYDHTKNKSKEPFYDGIMATMACMTRSGFQKHFATVPVKLDLNPGMWDGEHFLHHHSAATELLMSRRAGPAKGRSIAALYQPYKNSRHVFVMGPPSDALTEKVLAEIRKNASQKNAHLYIHFQGETWEDGTMTRRPNLFRFPFNWTGGWGSGGKQLRDMLAKCDTWTFRVRGKGYRQFQEPEGRSSINKCDTMWRSADGTMFRIPSIYVRIHRYMDCHLSASKTRHSVYKGFTLPKMIDSLRIALVGQDFHDKDNCMALSVLNQHAKRRAGIKLYLLGREVPEVKDTTGEPFFKVLNFSDDPPPSDGYGGHWPALKPEFREKYVQQYSDELTQASMLSLRDKFLELVRLQCRSMRDGCLYDPVPKTMTVKRSLRHVSRAHPKSDIAPFTENLFTDAMEFFQSGLL